ncbi:MAG: biosynthetic arginine decarboxylase [gamma proteobacterium symbiont of Bathyaustriella thionipta]|nr:biosynthetic arginine decarboxylase [gamma proteobacterium symbiont of Bathyaustriella thionipta]
MVDSSKTIYAIEQWGEGYFDINAEGHLSVQPRGNEQTAVDLSELVERICQQGLSLPLLIRFNDILHHRVQKLQAAFQRAQQKFHSGSGYTPLYPVKVNQQHSVVHEILATPGVKVGLEAGSKSELIAVLAMSRQHGVVVCNGYKDRQYIRLALMGLNLGLQLYIVVEKLSELPLILAESAKLGCEPLLGVRLRLSISAQGKWQNSGGDKAKFGLTAPQLLTFIAQLKSAGKLHCLKMLHGHAGSQISDLNDFSNGLTELARYYVELRQLGAPLEHIDTGGGLAVDYEGASSNAYFSMNYRLEEWAERMVSVLQQVCDQYQQPQPHIFTETGRAISAHHAVLISEVLEHETPQNTDSSTRENNAGLNDLQHLATADGGGDKHDFSSAEQDIQHLRQQFAEGVIDLTGIARAEQRFQQISATSGKRSDHIDELKADRWYCNFSLFQSLPDIWGLSQVFPIVPLQGLDKTPDRRAVIHDLTCDSDGSIQRYVDSGHCASTLPAYAINNDQPYRLGFFLVGAYQEILGDIHNLFGDTNRLSIKLDKQGEAQIVQAEKGDTTEELLTLLHYDSHWLQTAIEKKLSASSLDSSRRSQYFAAFKTALSAYTYLESLYE